MADYHEDCGTRPPPDDSPKDKWSSFRDAVRAALLEGRKPGEPADLGPETDWPGDEEYDRRMKEAEAECPPESSRS